MKAKSSVILRLALLRLQVITDLASSSANELALYLNMIVIPQKPRKIIKWMKNVAGVGVCPQQENS